MKRRSLIKSVITAGVGTPFLSCVNYSNTDNQSLKKIKQMALASFLSKQKK